MEILKFGLKFFKKYLPLALLTQLMGFSLIFLSLLMPQLARMIIDFVFIPLDSTYMGSEVAAEGIFSFLLDGYGGIGAMELMVNIALLSVALMAAKHILMYSRNSLQLVWGFKMERELKRLTFDKLLSTSNAVLSRYNTGDLMTIMVSDTVLFRDLYMRIIPYMLDALFAIGISVYFCSTSTAPPCAAFRDTLPARALRQVHKESEAINNEIRDSTANLSRNVQENINGVRIISLLCSRRFRDKKI